MKEVRQALTSPEQSHSVPASRKPCFCFHGPATANEKIPLSVVLSPPLCLLLMTLPLGACCHDSRITPFDMTTLSSLS